MNDRIPIKGKQCQQRLEMSSSTIAKFPIFVILHELIHPPSDDDFLPSSTKRPAIDSLQILGLPCGFSLKICTKLDPSTFAGSVGRLRESRTTTTNFLMGFVWEPQGVPTTTTASFAEIPLESRHPLMHAELACRAKPRLSSNDGVVGRYRGMALTAMRCDGCLELEGLREEWRVCGSGTRRKAKLCD